MLGNSLGYLLGRWGGRPLLARFKVRRDHLARLEGHFRRYGGGVVLVARFFDGLRQVNGIVAGMLEMPWRVFTGFNVLGAVLWTGVWGLGAYWLDTEISTVHHAFRRVEPFVVALTLVGFLALMVYLFRHRQTSKAELSRYVDGLAVPAFFQPQPGMRVIPPTRWNRGEAPDLASRRTQPSFPCASFDGLPAASGVIVDRTNREKIMPRARRADRIS